MLFKFYILELKLNNYIILYIYYIIIKVKIRIYRTWIQLDSEFYAEIEDTKWK
jgi:hypothetical protein